jgi:DNA-binding transcriptional MerR regulator
VTPKLYKAGEVCDATGLQPYVLRSWEKEFPGIGLQKSPEAPRLYRQSDVDQVMRIKQLVFGEGLTLAGARRRLEESAPRATVESRNAEIAEVLDTLGADVRKRIALVRSGLQSILEVLSTRPGVVVLGPMKAVPEPGRNGATRKDGTRNGNAGSRSSAPKRTRSGPSRQPARAAAAAAKRRSAAAKSAKGKRRRTSA